MIEPVISLIVERVPASSGDNLTGFAIDADHFFAEQALFHAVSVYRTDNASELLRVRLRLANRATTLQDISHALRSAWSSIAYSDFEASSITWYREATLLRFVTAMSGGVLAVTGSALVLGPSYPDAVREFEARFSRVPGIPGGLPKWAISPSD